MGFLTKLLVGRFLGNGEAVAGAEECIRILAAGVGGAAVACACGWVVKLRILTVEADRVGRFVGQLAKALATDTAAEEELVLAHGLGKVFVAVVATPVIQDS